MTAAHPNAGFELTGESQSLRQLLAQVWTSRRLILMLARKDFFVRYRRASFGMLWTIGLPLIQATVLAIVFSRVVRIETGTNFPTFIFAGIIPFSFFRDSINSATSAIVGGSDLATKVYFPRVVFPLVVVTTGLLALPANLVVLAAMALVFGVSLNPAELLWLVPGIVLLTAVSVGFAIVFSALQVYFRDVQHMVQAALLAWFYASPVIYPMGLAPAELRWVLIANPITGPIELFRAAIVGADPGWLAAVVSSSGWAVGLLIIGVWLHRRYDRVFTDLL